MNTRHLALFAAVAAAFAQSSAHASCPSFTPGPYQYASSCPQGTTAYIPSGSTFYYCHCDSAAPSSGGGNAYGGNTGSIDTRTAKDFENLCVTHLAQAGSDILKSKVANDKALNAAARLKAIISEQSIRSGSCHDVCKKYGQDREDWKNYNTTSVIYTSEPAASLQKKWLNKPEPAMPGDTAFRSCYNQAKLDNWCPSPAQSGPLEDIGNGPTRLNNYLDGTQVCAQDTAGFTLLNFSADDMKFKQWCAQPHLLDALERYKKERECLNTMESRKPISSTPLPPGAAISQQPAVPIKK